MANPSNFLINTIGASTAALVIPAGQTTAAAPFDCYGNPPLAILLPSGWLACTLTFKVLPHMSDDFPLPANSALAPVKSEANDGTLYTITTVDGLGYQYLSPLLFNGVRYINATSSVAQNATINLVLTPFWQGPRM